MMPAATKTDLAVLFENEAWQQPLFDALDRRGLSYTKYDLKSAAAGGHDLPEAELYFNQASPSAYVRGRPRVIPFTLALLRNLQIQGARVLSIPRPSGRGSGGGTAHRRERADGRRRHRVSRDSRWPSGLLRYQRKLQPAAPHRHGLRLRSFRACCGFPRAPTCCGIGRFGGG